MAHSGAGGPQRQYQQLRHHKSASLDQHKQTPFAVPPAPPTSTYLVSPRQQHRQPFYPAPPWPPTQAATFQASSSSPSLPSHTNPNPASYTTSTQQHTGPTLSSPASFTHFERFSAPPPETVLPSSGDNPPAYYPSSSSSLTSSAFPSTAPPWIQEFAVPAAPQTNTAATTKPGSLKRTSSNTPEPSSSSSLTTAARRRRRTTQSQTETDASGSLVTAAARGGGPLVQRGGNSDRPAPLAGDDSNVRDWQQQSIDREVLGSSGWSTYPLTGAPSAPSLSSAAQLDPRSSVMPLRLPPPPPPPPPRPNADDSEVMTTVGPYFDQNQATAQQLPRATDSPLPSFITYEPPAITSVVNSESVISGDMRRAASMSSAEPRGGYSTWTPPSVPESMTGARVDVQPSTSYMPASSSQVMPPQPPIDQSPHLARPSWARPTEAPYANAPTPSFTDPSVPSLPRSTSGAFPPLVPSQTVTSNPPNFPLPTGYGDVSLAHQQQPHVVAAAKTGATGNIPDELHDPNDPFGYWRQPAYQESMRRRPSRRRRASEHEQQQAMTSGYYRSKVRKCVLECVWPLIYAFRLQLQAACEELIRLATQYSEQRRT